MTAVPKLTGVLLAVLLAAPLPVGALYHNTGAPGRSENNPVPQRRVTTMTPTPAPEAPSPSPVPRGKLRRPEHAERLARVRGLVAGLTNKLTNLADRLARHVQNVERRIAALERSGRDISVDAELAAYRDAVGGAQQLITSILTELGALADSESPREVHQRVRLSLRELRAQLAEVRNTFKTLRDAIRDDVRASRASPTPTAAPVLPLVPQDSSPLVPIP